MIVFLASETMQIDVYELWDIFGGSLLELCQYAR